MEGPLGNNVEQRESGAVEPSDQWLSQSHGELWSVDGPFELPRGEAVERGPVIGCGLPSVPSP